MPLETADLEFFKDTLDPSEIFDGTSPAFSSHTVPWSLSYDLHPQIAVAPSTLAHLQDLVRYIYDREHIGFTIRGRGVGSTSAQDVIISMRNFQEVRFDAEKQVVEVGAGLDWGEIDQELATLAPGFVVVGARCPYVGVAGSTLAGGLSWLSHELGLESDPKNMLDAEIVLRDGRAIWASEHPDVLWALRGGGGNFGVVTRFRLQAYNAPTSIFAGMLHFPPSAVPTISSRLSRWMHTHHTPQTALHLFVFDFSQQSLHGVGEPSLVAIIFDALGEEHARTEDNGFRWLFSMPEAREDLMSEKTLSQVHELQRSTEKAHGTATSWLQAALVGDDDVDEQFLVRAWDWYHGVVEDAPELALGTFALFEVMQQAAFNSAAPASTAWPHGGKDRQHVMQMSVGGGAPTADEKRNAHVRATALDTLARGPAQITNKATHPPGNFLPNFLLENHDIKAVYGLNWDRLRAVKLEYDPLGRFGRGDSFIPPLKR